MIYLIYHDDDARGAGMNCTEAVAAVRQAGRQSSFFIGVFLFELLIQICECQKVLRNDKLVRNGKSWNRTPPPYLKRSPLFQNRSTTIFFTKCYSLRIYIYIYLHRHQRY